MSRLSTFFRNSNTEFGIFYPRHYLLAVFPNLADADRAKQELNDAGFVDGGVISAPGDEVVHVAEHHLLKDGLLGVLMTEMSLVIGIEALYADRDLAAAKKGAAFVAVYCPTEKAKTEAWKLLKPPHPLVARYYSLGGIEHLAGED